MTYKWLGEWNAHERGKNSKKGGGGGGGGGGNELKNKERK